MIYSYYVIIIIMYIVCIVEKYFSLNFLFGSPIQDPHTWNLIFQLSVSRKRKREKFSCESLHMRECENWNRWSTHSLSSLWAFCIMYFAIHPSQHFVYFYSVHYLHKLNFRLVYIFNSDHTTTLVFILKRFNSFRFIKLLSNHYLHLLSCIQMWQLQRLLGLFHHFKNALWSLAIIKGN